MLRGVGVDCLPSHTKGKCVGGGIGYPLGQLRKIGMSGVIKVVGLTDEPDRVALTGDIVIIAIQRKNHPKWINLTIQGGAGDVAIT